MLKKLICCLFHGKYHEVGTSRGAKMTDGSQFWQCQWWCPKCGRQWQTVTKIEKLVEPDWDPPILVKREFASDGTFAKE